MAAMGALRQQLSLIAERQDEQSWHDLVTTQGSDLLRVSRSMIRDPQLADDAVQEALLYLRDHAGDCQANSDDGARAWMMRVAHTAALQVLRRQTRRLGRDRRAGELHASTEPATPDEQLADKELHDSVRAELQALPSTQREPLVMHIMGGLDYEAIGEALSCTPGNARVRVHRGLKRMRTRLQRIGLVLTLIVLQRSIAEAATDTNAGDAIPRWQSLLNSDRHVTWKIPGTLLSGGVLMSIAALILIAGAAITMVVPGDLPRQSDEKLTTSLLDEQAQAVKQEPSVAVQLDQASKAFVSNEDVARFGDAYLHLDTRVMAGFFADEVMAYGDEGFLGGPSGTKVTRDQLKQSFDRLLASNGGSAQAFHRRYFSRTERTHIGDVSHPKAREYLQKAYVGNPLVQHFQWFDTVLTIRPAGISPHMTMAEAQRIAEGGKSAMPGTWSGSVLLLFRSVEGQTRVVGLYADYRKAPH